VPYGRHTITKANGLVTAGEIFVARIACNTYIKSLLGHNKLVEFFSVQPNDKYSYRYDLIVKGLTESSDFCIQRSLTVTLVYK
jgi:hypothetical protein